MSCRSCRMNPAGDRFAGRLDGRKERKIVEAHGRLLPLTSLVNSASWLRIQPGIYKGHPVLTLDPPLLLHRRTKGKKPQSVPRVKILTATTKMRCWSFSLPAGPPGQGGTCISSTLPAKPGSVPICAGCYATSGMYGMYDSVVLQQQIRKEWVRRTMNSGHFAQLMGDALEMVWATRVGVPSSWAIMLVDKGEVDRHGDKYKVGNVIDPKFFRLHDSGDLGWIQHYATAWSHIAMRFPMQKFWAPTRDLWTRNTQLHGELDEMARRFILRPSAYHFWDMPPDFGGHFAAGTSAAKHLPGVRDCPAVLAGVKKTHGKTCSSAHCRRCWLQPDMPVAYAPHGEGVEEAPGAGIKLKKAKPRKNPGLPPLIEVVSAYERGPRANPAGGDGLGGFLNDNDLNPSDYTEDDWQTLFDRRGIAPDERLEVMEQLAEWDL